MSMTVKNTNLLAVITAEPASLGIGRHQGNKNKELHIDPRKFLQLFFVLTILPFIMLVQGRDRKRSVK